MSVKHLFFAFVAWIAIAGYFLEGNGFGWALFFGGLVAMLIWQFTKHEVAPILKKMPDGDADDNEDIDFTKLPGYVPPEKRKAVPRDNEQHQQRPQRPQRKPENL